MKAQKNPRKAPSYVCVVIGCDAVGGLSAKVLRTQIRPRQQNSPNYRPQKVAIRIPRPPAGKSFLRLPTVTSRSTIYPTSQPKEESGQKLRTCSCWRAAGLAASKHTRTEDEVLKRQSLTSKLLPGWHLPAPEGLPVPTFAPAIMAMGIVFFVMGIVTTWYVCVAGIIVFAVATWLWVAELQGD